jgi:3-hydroxyisobutyrate dehydrogenase-like beta-hydroxyacid dehydrogenase
MDVAFLGLGIMGSRMAQRLAAQGHRVTAWNRTPGKAGALPAAATPAEAAARADAVCLCLADPPAVESVFSALALREGQLVIDFSTGSPALAARLDAACRTQGAAFLESPVTGSKNGAAAGTLVLMVGGEEAALERAHPLLASVASKVIHIGPVGSASRVKLIGNGFIALMLEALCEGVLLARKAGISPEKMLEVVQSSGYASPYWDFKGKAILARDFETHFSVDLMHKDLTLALAAADEAKVPVPGLALAREQFQRLRAAGKGGLDIAALIQALE